jgi:anti-anti-sigma regulatory factor
LVGQHPEAGVTTLPQVLDLTAANALRDNLAALLDGRTVVLDAAGVERMSTPCAQVLLAAGRTAGPGGAAFRILGASAVFRAALADLGLQAEFSKWMD